MADQKEIDLVGKRVWDTETAFNRLNQEGLADTKRTAERRLHEYGILPELLEAADLKDEQGRPANQVLVEWALAGARKKRWRPLFVQLHQTQTGQLCLHANDLRNARYWVALHGSLQTPPSPAEILDALKRIQHHLENQILALPHGSLVGLLRHSEAPANIHLPICAYPPVLPEPDANISRRNSPTPHLKKLEAESIHIIREAVAEAENPAMLYSIGKDSSVMLHLARKAFYPAPPPFPLLHVDTRWKFQEMYLFRDYMAKSSGMDLLVHINPEAIERDINPFDHGSALHTTITKTEGLKQALDHYKFDVVFGGARRDEEKSRAKERIFSFRSKTHQWNPKNQRPELWSLYNTRKAPGESIRVFPLSNWTELDVWQYIHQENIPMVPLYFAKKRPVVVRDGLILMVDDDRFRLMPGETIEERVVRFRTLGCYPLSGAIESSATNLPEIILELINSRISERQGRAIDNDGAASMEKKKQEGYF